MPEHTPLPWYALGWGISAEARNVRRPVAMCVPITPMSGRENAEARRTSDEQQRANAKFIVLAVNTHDDLLAALEDLLKSYESIVHDEYDGTSSLTAWLVKAARARAAIAKVKGG